MSFSLNRARQNTLDQGVPIVTPFKAFRNNGIHFRRGELSMIASPPGLGKSILSQSIVQRGDDIGMVQPTLYVSADSSPATVWERSAAMATGYRMSDVQRLVEENNTQYLDAEVQKATRHIRYVFNNTLGLGDLEDELNAYATIYGAWPEIIVLDNISNIMAGDGENEFRDIGDALQGAREIAGQTGAAVIALHHVGGTYDNGDMAIPLGGIRGKASKPQALILTLFQAGPQVLGVSVVKNRSGKSDPSGKFFVQLGTDLERAAISDY